MTKTPLTSLDSNISCVLADIIAGSIPKNGLVALPGFVSVTPGKGVMRIPTSQKLKSLKFQFQDSYLLSQFANKYQPSHTENFQHFCSTIPKRMD